MDAPLDPANANRYAYAGADSINNQDPTGRCNVGEIIGGVAIGVGLTIGVASELGAALTGGPEADLLIAALEGEAVGAEYGVAAYLVAAGSRSCD